ncbi:MAG: hypothetical protein IJ124_03945 [Clostridia bacterium]|nr:hypothetical protein [Clostridia bacterium]
MTSTQKIVLIALAVAGVVCLLVGLSLMHYIGGFMRTVEDEARKEKEERDAPDIESDENTKNTGA